MYLSFFERGPWRLAGVLLIATVVVCPAATVRLAWDGISDEHLSNFRVHWGTLSRGAAAAPSDFAYEHAIPVDAARTNFAVGGLELNRTYYFAVTARNASGESVYSREVSCSVADADHDGMADAWEQANAVGDGTGDSDDDGVCDLDEFIAGTCPTNAQSCLQVGRVEWQGRNRIIHFEVQGGRFYTLECKGSLADPEWMPVFRTSCVEGPVCATDSFVRVTQRFYRLRVSN